MSVNKILVAGLHDTGKTTFIAALWHFVNFATDKKKLTLHSLSKGEHEYLNSICNDWLEFKRVARTSDSAGGKHILMSLKKVDNNDLVDLEIPDFSGEAFNNQFEHREWSVEFDELLDNTNGILLFVNAADNNNRPQLIFDANEAAALMGAEPLTTNEGVELKQFRTEDIPNQVKLIDLLQFFQYYKLKILPVKIVIMISAWDIVEPIGTSNQLTPEEWIRLNLPLLHQFLNCNRETFNSKYLGISAQGCDYDNVEEVEIALTKNPSERVIIKEENNHINDITKYIVWLTE